MMYIAWCCLRRRVRCRCPGRGKIQEHDDKLQPSITHHEVDEPHHGRVVILKIFKRFGPAIIGKLVT